MPYFTQVRMRATCRAETVKVAGSEAIGVSGGGPAGAVTGSTRGSRADWSAGAVCRTAGGLIGNFDANSASAAWRALMIRS